MAGKPTSHRQKPRQPTSPTKGNDEVINSTYRAVYGGPAGVNAGLWNPSSPQYGRRQPLGSHPASTTIDPPGSGSQRALSPRMGRSSQGMTRTLSSPAPYATDNDIDPYARRSSAQAPRTPPHGGHHSSPPPILLAKSLEGSSSIVSASGGTLGHHSSSRGKSPPSAPPASLLVSSATGEALSPGFYEAAASSWRSSSETNSLGTQSAAQLAAQDGTEGRGAGTGVRAEAQAAMAAARKAAEAAAAAAAAHEAPALLSHLVSGLPEERQVAARRLEASLRHHGDPVRRAVYESGGIHALSVAVESEDRGSELRHLCTISLGEVTVLPEAR
jgi:hypothetical protein